jgi:hypothetical protein
MLDRESHGSAALRALFAADGAGRATPGNADTIGVIDLPVAAMTDIAALTPIGLAHLARGNAAEISPAELQTLAAALYISRSAFRRLRAHLSSLDGKFTLWRRRCWPDGQRNGCSTRRQESEKNQSETHTSSLANLNQRVSGAEGIHEAGGGDVDQLRRWSVSAPRQHRGARRTQSALPFYTCFGGCQLYNVGQGGHFGAVITNNVPRCHFAESEHLKRFVSSTNTIACWNLMDGPESSVSSWNLSQTRWNIVGHLVVLLTIPALSW